LEQSIAKMHRTLVAVAACCAFVLMPAHSGAAPADVAGVPTVDLAITKSATPSVAAGEVITYTVVVTNISGGTAQAVQLSDVFPAGVSPAPTFGAGTNWPPGGCAIVANVATCTAASLAAGQSLTAVFSGTVAANTAGGTVISNTATVSSPSDTNTANDSATATTTIQNPATDLSITKAHTPASPVAGGPVTYTIVVTNAGLVATTATVTDVVPAAITGVTWTCATNASACGPTGMGDINDNITISPGGTVTYTLSGTIAANASGLLVNSATVQTTGNVNDLDPVNNTAFSNFTVTASGDVAVTKTGPATVVPGTSASYTVTVTNTGLGDAQNVTLSDVIPAGTTFGVFDAAVTWGVCASPPTGPITCSEQTLASGATRTLVYSVNVGANVANGSTLTNTATVASTPADSNLNNNVASATSTAVASADVSVSITDAPDPVTAGSNVSYAINVTNAGPSATANTVLSFLVPAHSTFVSLASPMVANCTTPSAGGTGTITCTIASSLAPASSLAFTAVVNVDPPFAGTLTATASVTSGVNDPNPLNNSATTTTTVNPLLLPVTGVAVGLGSIDCITPVQFGQTTTCTVLPASGNAVSSISGCGGTLAADLYTTGPITVACTVTVVFVRTSIPTLSDVTLLAMSALLALVAAATLHRRRRRVTPG